MARLIDIEIVFRNAENEPITEIFPNYAELSMETKIAIRMYAQYWKTTLKDAPTIDPVIRCRDCAVPHNKWTGCPKLNGLVPPDNFYCAFGVRRDSDGKSD